MAERLNHHIEDKIYGVFDIESPSIVDLINSPAIQRMKGINQFGLPDNYYHLNGFPRYDHSIGAMLLVKSLGGSNEEQVAALYHDTSHKAFSHVYDWIVSDYRNGNNNENSQDKSHKEFILRPEIKSTLENNGFSPTRIADFGNFSLLDQPSPELCADRIDYSLRELDSELARYIFKDLTVVDNKIVFKSYDIAVFFAREYLNIQEKHWGGYEAASRYHQLATALKRALSLNIINLDDFDEDDNFIISKLESCQDAEIVSRLIYLRQKELPPADDGIRVYKKFRYVDPLFLTSGSLFRLSSVDESFENLLMKSYKENRNGIIVSK